MHYSDEVVEKGLRFIEAQGLTDLHRTFLRLIPEGSKVLEVGCASGYLSQALQGQGCWVTGVEQVPKLADLARERVDLLIERDFEDPAARAQLPRDHDVILLADVIEHFADPWQAVRVLKEHAQPNALWLITFPNVTHIAMRLRMLRGDWQYEDFGILDRTHLRFFSLPSVKAFLREVDLRLEDLQLSAVSYPGRGVARRLGSLDGWLQERFPNLVGSHFLTVARSAL